MKLAELIRGKSHEIVKIRSDKSIAEAATALTENKIGALLVEDQDGTIAGILSERDIVGGMAPHGADLHDVEVSELMTTNVIRCSPNDSVNEAMAMMTDRRIRHLPVVDGESLTGLVSIGDLVRFQTKEQSFQIRYLEEYISGR